PNRRHVRATCRVLSSASSNILSRHEINRVCSALFISPTLDVFASRTEREKCHPSTGISHCKAGGPDRDRTGDLLNAIQARSQLRYRPTEEETTLHYSEDWTLFLLPERNESG